MDSDHEFSTYTEPEDSGVGEARRIYSRTVADLEEFFDYLIENYDEVRNEWPGKSRDLRKWGTEAFPWEGASDGESWVIGERIWTLVASSMRALSMASIRAYPVEVNDASRAKVVSAFLKWMVQSYIRGFREEMELAANRLYEQGIAITRVGWRKKVMRRLQVLNLDEIEAAAPEFAEVLADADNDDAVVMGLMQAFPNTNEARARKALRELRATGMAELAVSKEEDEGPWVRCMASDVECFFPVWTIGNIQDAPYYYERHLMTPQQVIERANLSDPYEAWDAEWCEEVAEKGTGAMIEPFSKEGRRESSVVIENTGDNDLIEVIVEYRRLVDRVDGAEGIYCSVFHATIGGENDIPEYAKKRKLVNGMRNYPVVVTRLMKDQHRLYDVQSLARRMRGLQWGVKAQRDQRTDAADLATLPPMTYKSGRPVPKWEPGAKIPRVRSDDYTFGDTPPPPASSIEIENTQLEQADRLCGLSPEQVGGEDLRWFYVSKLLEHVRDVLKLCYEQFNSYGPDEVWFRVTGFADARKFEKGSTEERFDVTVDFDSMHVEPEAVEQMLAQIGSLKQYDVDGRIDMGEVVEFAANVISPALADRVVKGQEESMEQVQKETIEDWTALWSGVEVGARPNGGRMRMQVLQTIMQQPDVQEALQQNEALAARVEKHIQQYQFQQQQIVNAQTGRIGTPPADFQGMNTDPQRQPEPEPAQNGY